jgi:hypothetical protein
MADGFDPIAILRVLDERRVNFVLIGDMAEVANGSPLGFGDVEVTVQLKDENVERLETALADLAPDGRSRGRAAELAEHESTLLETRFGSLWLTPTPSGTRGYDDVRRKASRMHLARGLRVEVADVRDLVRIENAGDADRVRIATLQRIEMQLSRSLDRGMDL